MTQRACQTCAFAAVGSVVARGVMSWSALGEGAIPHEAVGVVGAHRCAGGSWFDRLLARRTRGDADPDGGSDDRGHEDAQSRAAGRPGRREGLSAVPRSLAENWNEWWS